MTTRSAAPSGASIALGSRSADRTHAHPRPTFVWAFAAFLVANMFNKYGVGPELPIGADRIFFAAGVVLFVLDRRYSWRETRLSSVHLAAIAMTSLAALSGLFYGTVLTSYGFFAVLDRLAVPYLALIFGPVVFARAEDRVLLMRVVMLMGVYLGLSAIAEVLGPQSLVWPRYVVDPDVGIGYGRARGPFGASEADGLTLLAALWCAFAHVRSSGPGWWRRFAQLAMLLSAVGALLTLTRSIWLGLVVGLVAVALVDRRSRRAIAVSVLVVGLVGWAVVAASTTVRDDVVGRATYQRSVDDRQNTNAAALRAIAEHPVTGIGWVRFLAETEIYVRQSDDYPLTNTQIEVHNVVLSRAAELGLPAAALWVLTVVLGPGLGVVRRGWLDDGAWRVVLAGTFSGWLVAVMLSPVPYPLPNTLMWLFAGLALLRPADRMREAAASG